MGSLEQRPVHVRKRLALVWTAVVGVILVVILIVVYSHPMIKDNGSVGRLRNFYNTILQSAQSSVNPK